MGESSRTMCARRMRRAMLRPARRASQARLPFEATPRTDPSLLALTRRLWTTRSRRRGSGGRGRAGRSGSGGRRGSAGGGAGGPSRPPRTRGSRHRAGAVASSRASLGPPEEDGAGGGEDAAGAVAEGDLGILDLARAALAPELPHALDQREDPEDAGVAEGEAAALGVRGKGPARRRALARDEGPALALLAEAQVLERQEDRDRERVVDLRHVNVVVAESRHLKRAGPGEGGAGHGEVGHLAHDLVRVGLAQIG